VKRWGQVDLKPVVTHLLGVGLAWFGGTAFARYGYAQDLARETAENTRRSQEQQKEIEDLRSAFASLPVEALKQVALLPVAELREMPVRFSTLEAAVEHRRPPRRPGPP
jgi:hypothetical protein